MEENPEEPIDPKDEIMSKDTCYLTDKETKIQNEIIEEKNKTYIEGFGYATPSKVFCICRSSEIYLTIVLLPSRLESNKI